MASFTITSAPAKAAPRAVRIPFRLVPSAGLLAAFLSIAVLFQLASGAYFSELTASADEPAHYLTSLMVRDYLVSGMPGSARGFAERFYIHYPKLGIGTWPPVFYLLDGLWMTVAPPSRESSLFFMAMLAAAIAFALYRALRVEFGRAGAFAAAVGYLSLPLTQWLYGAVMVDLLVALFCLYAMLAYARYLETGAARHAAWFGVLAGLAILTKGTGFTLALIPLLATVLARRTHLFKARSFYLPAAIVFGMAFPWYMKTIYMLGKFSHYSYGEEFFREAVPFYASRIVLTTGPVLFPVALAGIYAKVIRPWRQGGVRPLWATAVSMLAAVPLFLCFMTADIEYRYTAAMAPPLVMFVAAGARWFSEIAGRRVRRNVTAFAAVAVVIVYLATAFAVPRKRPYGYSAVADGLLSNPGLRESVFLICSTGPGEGMLISEVAMRERRPGHIVLRATKMLATSDWHGRDYQAFYKTPREVMDYLDSVPVGVVILDAVPDHRKFEHQRLLERALEMYPDRWELIGAFPSGRAEDSAGIRVYSLRGHQGRPVKPIQITVPLLGTAVKES